MHYAKISLQTKNSHGNKRKDSHGAASSAGGR
jgi:hypothetical protein